MSDPDVIYLQPECCADESVGRLWCEDNAPDECPDGVPWTKYVRAEKVDELALIVTCNAAGQAVSVTRQDRYGQIHAVLWESPPADDEAVRLLRELRDDIAHNSSLRDEYQEWNDSIAAIDAYLARVTPNVTPNPPAPRKQ